ncbi:DUF885 domain-containing protein [Pseudoduganella ginsengisoli]|uniref:DUF885 family protein n=1 Tax=Pseudoduganella ginsengisoli TaxID=1462440 RepID=A0A6L6Q0M2_9BURK|nr:DUF885 domain-containing protein [Pseudoduganella ginsengisoli]MTW03423.1 DUF885 family protein [Pseudoduganella ginsengisoli]
MKNTLKWLLTVTMALLLLAVLLVTHTSYFKPLRLDWFYMRTFALFALESPEMLSSMRLLPPMLDFYGSRLDDVSVDHDAKMMRRMKEDLVTLDSYDRAGLDRDGKLSYDTLHYYMRIQAEGEPYLYHALPLNQMAGMQVTLPEFMVQVHQIGTRGEGEDYVARLELFPRKFAQLLDKAKYSEAKGIYPPRFMVDKVLKQMSDFVAVPPQQNTLYVNMREKLARIPASAMDDASRQKVLARTADALANRVYPAYGSLIAHFRELQGKVKESQGAWSMPDGDAYYAWAVRMHTTTRMTPQQIHALGLSEVARVGAEMDVILRQQGLTEGSIGKRVQQLASNPEQKYPSTEEGKKAMLTQYQAILDEINEGVDSAFEIRPKLGVEVRQVPPESQDAAPGAYYMPGAFDGSRPGIFYANMRAPGETPKFAMRTLAYHEGIPGHHFQIQIAQELQGVPFFRKVIPFTAYQEGWALYAERLASELGFQKTPMDNLGRLRDEMLRATRLVVDSGIHYKHWTREQAIAYMMDNTGMAEGDVIAEVERYFVDPGQALAYKVGMLKILALREQAREELGVKFDLKQFHNEVLSHGALPLTVLERLINEWIALKKRGDA